MIIIEKFNQTNLKLRIWLSFALLFYTLFNPDLLTAQRDTTLAPGRVPPPGNAADTSKRRGILSDFVDTDSFKVQYYFPGKESAIQFYSDTSGYRFSHQYDPARRRTFDNIHLGIPGSPFRSIWYTHAHQRGNLPGIDAYSAAHKRALELPFYKDLPSTFSALTLLRGADQDNFIFAAKFAQNFSNDIQLSLDYQRDAQVSDFRRFRLKNSSFNIGLKLHPWKSVIKSYFIFCMNSNLQENNGGVTNLEFFRDPAFNVRVGVPVYLNNAQTYIFNRTFALHNDIQTDRWIPGFKMKYTISHFAEQYKFFDKSDSTVLATYYGALATESRGLRNAYDFSTFEQKASALWASPPVKWFKIDQLRADLIFRNSNWNQGGTDEKFNELYFRGTGKLSFSEYFSAGISWETGLGDAAFNSQLKADVLFKWGKYISLDGSYQRNSNLPSLLSRALILSFTEIYRMDLPQQVSNSWEARLQIPYTRSKAHARLTSLSNGLYFDSEFRPQVLTENATIAQLGISQLFYFKRIFLDLNATLQTSSAPELGIPPVFAKASLYYEGPIFNEHSTFRIGADSRYIENYNGLGFVPAHSQFYYSGESLQDYLEVDAFIAMRVKVFNVSVRVENLLNTFTGNVGFHHLRYPTQDFGFRIGINWILLN